MPKHDESSPDLLPHYLQEDQLTDECKGLMPSLPKEKGWVASYLYQYQGFWYAPQFLQGALACQKHFEAQDSDILLVTTPKSGTTWLKALAFALMRRKEYRFDRDHPLHKTSPHDLVPFLDLRIYVESQTPDLSRYGSPRLFASHLPFDSMPKSVNESACKVVYLCRNPKDILVSLWHFTNKLRPREMESIGLEDAVDKFCRGVSLYGSFWHHVLGYWKESLENPKRVLFLKFEDLQENPTFHLSQLAQFMGCPFSSEEEESGVIDEILSLCGFDNLSNLEVNRSGKLSSGEENKAFFRRGEVGDWKNFLTTEMVNRMNFLSEQKLHPYGLEL